MDWIALTVGVCLVSALLPLVNAEIYVVGLAVQQPQLSWWLVGSAAAVGQMAGKLVFYYAGRGSLRLPDRPYSFRRIDRRRGPDPSGHGRWSARVTRFQQTCQDRPIWTAGVLLVAAGLGVPPLAATSFAAGVARVRTGLFLGTGLVGRFVRFGALAASPGLLGTWWF